MGKTRQVQKDFSTGGVVWDAEKKRVLMIQVQNLSEDVVWTFPKGHPESNESDEDAALREVLEETGWESKIEQPLMEVQYFYSYKGVTYDKKVRWFFMKPLQKKGTFDPKEVLQSDWCELEKARTLVIYKSDKDLLKKLSKLI